MPGPAHIALLQNAALLLAMVVVFDLVTGRLRLESKPAWQVLVGAILGGLGIGLMLAAFRLESGIVFDTRSVLLSVSGLFFGTIPTLVAMVLTAAFRLWQGGAGGWTGAFVILATGCLGILWRRHRRGRLEDISARELYLFGVVAHLVMLGLMLTLPWETARRVLAGIGLPVLGIYPLATAALGLLLANRLRRERLRNELVESEERYRSLFQNNHATMLIVNPADGAIVDANPAACRFYGWTREQLRQMHISQVNILPPDQLQAEMDRARAKEDYHFLFTHRRADGSLRDVEVFSGPVSTGDQHLLYSIIHDITERKRAQAALRESEERYRQIVETAHEGIWCIDAESRCSFVNQRMLDMLGYKAEEMLGRPLTDFLRPEDAADHARQLEARRQGRPGHFERRYRHANGEWRWMSVSATPQLDATGRFLGSFAMFTDITERRQAEQQLRQLSHAVEQNPASIVITDLSGAIEYVNPKFTEVTGYTLAEVRGHNPRILKSGEMPAAIYQSLWATIRHGGSWQGELLNRRKNGELFWEQATISPITDTDGRITHYVGVKEDITERKRLTEVLRQSEERYRNLVETSADWVWEIDANERYTYASPKVVELLGYAPEEVLGRRPFDFMPETEAQRVAAFFHELAVKREPFTCLENINRHKDGHLVILETSAVPILGPQGEYQGYRGMDRDITARKQAEDALRASEERFRTLVESAPLGIFVQTGGRFTYVNQAALRMFGTASRDQLLGQSVLARFHPDCHAQVRERIRRLNEERQSVPLAEQKCLRLDGTAFDAEFAAVPFTYDGEPGALVFFQELTERKRLEAQLRQAQKLEAIGQLAGGVAHDFNNILAAIMMHLGLLQMNTALDEETRHALKDLDTEAQRAANLTRQLLMFSRRSVLAVKPLDLNEVVANLLKMLSRLIGEHVDLRFEGTAGLPLVEADAGMLEQVLMNLVVNARDAMPKGGRVTIATSQAMFAADGADINRERRPGRFVCLAVSDTGTGMDAATLRRIFDPFFTTKEAGKGTGLGLATVHGIVAQHKGWVEVESEVGRGTTFRVFLPAQAAMVTESPTAQPAAPIPRGRETVLLVEDDPKVRQMMGQALRVLGYRVFEAVNGQEAMKLWQTHGAQVDLLLTDMVMPEGITGLELTERLQALRPGLKAIISSGYSAEIVQSGVPTKSGVVYLPKPYEARKLAEVVRQCLDRKT